MTKKHLIDRVLQVYPTATSTYVESLLMSAIDEFCSETGVTLHEFEIVSDGNTTEYRLPTFVNEITRVESPGNTNDDAIWRLDGYNLFLGTTEGSDENSPLKAFNSGTITRIYARSKVDSIEAFLRTYQNAASGLITATSDNGSGKIRCTSVGHPLSMGDKIVVAGFTAQTNGTYFIDVISPDQFDLRLSTFVTNESGSWTRAAGATDAGRASATFRTGTALGDTAGVPSEFHDAPIFKALSLISLEASDLDPRVAQMRHLNYGRLYDRKVLKAKQHVSLRGRTGVRTGGSDF